jgi:hypothetical protein
MEGQYSNPVRVISFNTSEGWSRDSSEDIADELVHRIAARGDTPPTLEEFLDRYASVREVQLALL